MSKKPFSASLHVDNINYIINEVEKKQQKNSRYNKSHWLDDLVTHLRTKSKSKAKPKTELVVVDNLNIDAWDKWIAFRRKAKFKAYKTDATKIKLAGMGNYEEQMLIVQNSIDLEYQGLFPLKVNNSAASKDVLQDSADSDWHLQDQGF